MTISTTPGALGRVRALILLATAAVVLTSALAATGAQAGPPPEPRKYLVTADLDGRLFPEKNQIYETDFLRKGERVQIECQKYGGPAYGSKLWDLVSKGGQTLYVPDRFIKTGTDGRSPEIRRCDSQDEAKSGLVTDPFE
jgi:hypothetical protein